MRISRHESGLSAADAIALEGDTVRAAALALESAGVLHFEAVQADGDDSFEGGAIVVGSGGVGSVGGAGGSAGGGGGGIGGGGGAVVPSRLSSQPASPRTNRSPAGSPPHAAAVEAAATAATAVAATAPRLETRASVSILKKKASTASNSASPMGEPAPEAVAPWSLAPSDFGPELAHAFDLIFDAYIQLDVGKRGIIRRNDLASAMEELALLSPSGRDAGGAAQMLLPKAIRTRDDIVGATAERSASSSASAAAPVAAASTAASAAAPSSTSSGQRSRSSSFAAPPAAVGVPPAAPQPQLSSALEFLTSDRFSELDWDSNGEVTFSEFLLAFMAWIGVDDTPEEARAEISARRNLSRNGSVAEGSVGSGGGGGGGSSSGR
jgi:calcium-binding protein CML